jgi:hypothetical protein
VHSFKYTTAATVALPILPCRSIMVCRSL